MGSFPGAAATPLHHPLTLHRLLQAFAPRVTVIVAPVSRTWMREAILVKLLIAAADRIAYQKAIVPLLHSIGMTFLHTQ